MENEYNLDKTTLFTIEIQELLEIFWQTYCFNSQDFFTFTCIYSFSSLAKMCLSIQNKVSPRLEVFLECSLGFLSESIDCEQKSLDLEGLEI